MLQSFLFGSHSSGASPSDAPELIFYDGHCGLCHGLVRFVIARDRSGIFRFAPLGGETLRRAVPEEVRATLPDSIVLLTATGAVLTRSTAVLHILQQLGGAWRMLGLLARLSPRPLRDFFYDCLAAIRQHLFSRPAETCPLVAPNLRSRFDD